MKIHQLSIEEALESLHTRSTGLTPTEAAKRQTEYGPNVIQKKKQESLLLRFLKGFTHFFALILWLAAALAFFAHIHDPGSGMATLGFAIVAVIVINNTFSFWQEFRVEEAILELQKLLPKHSTVLRSGELQEVAAEEIVPGDLLALEAGDDVPADCRIIESIQARVNNSAITGESAPHARDAQPDFNADFLEGRNTLLAGSSLISGKARAVVFATGARTAFGQIANLTQTIKSPMSPLQLEIARLSRLVAILAVALGCIFYVIGRAIGLSFWANFMFAIGVIVANVPEGLLPTVTLALAMGSQRLAKRNALIRHLPAVETLGATSVICTDKTGTLTENRLTAKRLWLAGKLIDAENLDPGAMQSCRRFFDVARECHNLRRTHSLHWAGDPLEIALVELAGAHASEREKFPRIDEAPFDSDRRRMSTLHTTGADPILFTKGAAEAILPLCESIARADEITTLSADVRREIIAVQARLAHEGLRVIALAWRENPVGASALEMENGLTFGGLVGLRDPPRPQVQDAIAKCGAAGIKVIVVTGDHPQTATAMAKEIGLAKESDAVVAITGDRLAKMSDTQLQLALDSPHILFARVAAYQKMRIVEALKRKGAIVAVTGDGVNDAPALKSGDIGIAMGAGGTDVARESADMVLLDDNFATIVAAIEEGRAVYANIRKFLTYILTSNIPELVPYLAFVLFKIPLALTVIQILAVDLGTDLLPALALGTDPPHRDVMSKPPRPRLERLLSGGLMARAYLWLGLIQAGAAMAVFFFVLHEHRWRYGEALAPSDDVYRQATAACLSAIVVMQIVNVFNCRSRRDSVFSPNVIRNPMIFWAILLEVGIILAIDYTPWGNSLFATQPIAITTWLLMAPFGLAFLLLEEFRKWMARRTGRSARGSSLIA